MNRLYRRRASGGSDSQSGTSGSWRDSSASAGTIPSSFCRANTFSPEGSPPASKYTRVPVRPFFRRVVRRVRGAEAQVQVERLGRVDLLDVGNELHRLVDQV